MPNFSRATVSVSSPWSRCRGVLVGSRRDAGPHSKMQRYQYIAFCLLPSDRNICLIFLLPSSQFLYPFCPSQFLQYRIEASPGSLSVGALPAACTSPWQWRLPPPSAPPRSLVLTCSLSRTLICPVCIPIFSLLPLLFSWF